MARSIQFEWLDEPKRRRGALVLVRKAVREGWLEGPEHAEARADLVARLSALADDPTLGVRELLQLARTFQAMDWAGIRNAGIPGIPALR